MIAHLIVRVLVSIVVIWITGCAPRATEQSASAGEEAGPPSVDAKSLELEDLQGMRIRPLENVSSKATVFVLIRSDCPVANRYAPEIQALCGAFEPQGVAWYLVYPDPREGVEAIKRHQFEFGYQCSVLRDTRHALVEATGATITPEAVVFRHDEGKSHIVYRGRIDDRVNDFGKARPAPGRRDVREVLESIVEGRPTPFRATKAVGCPIPELP